MGQPIPIALDPSFNVSRVAAQSIATFINMYAEPGRGKGQFVGIGYPGQVALATLGPIRGVLEDPRATGLFYAVAGSTFCSVAADGVATTIGTVPGSDLVEWAVNAFQIAIAAESRMFVYDVPTAVFTENTDPDFLGCSSLDCVNKTGIWSVPNSGRFQISAIDNFLTVAALDVATAESKPDPLVCIRVVNNEPFMLGTKSVEPWPNTGAANFPFERRTVNQNVGCVARDSARLFANTLMFLGRDANSDTLAVYRFAGYDAQAVSGHVVGRLLDRTQHPERARAVVWGVEGHQFYTLTTDAGSVTLDEATGLWHQTASGSWPHGSTPPASKWTCRALMGRNNIFGDTDGRLTRMSFDATDDAGEYLTQELVTPMTGATGLKMTTYTVEAELDVGTGTATNNPAIQLQTLKDGGHRVSAPREARLGLKGAYGTRPRWSRLGASRDLALRLRVTGARFNIVQLWARVETRARS